EEGGRSTRRVQQPRAGVRELAEQFLAPHEDMRRRAEGRAEQIRRHIKSIKEALEIQKDKNGSAGLFRALTAPPPGSRARGPRRSARAGDHTRRWRIVDPAAEGVPHGLVLG